MCIRDSVYISCNPTTQVRDLAFLRQRGYAVRTVQPVDMLDVYKRQDGNEVLLERLALPVHRVCQRHGGRS